MGDCPANRAADGWGVHASRVSGKLEDTPGIVLADEHITLIPLSKKRVYVDPFCFKILVEANIADESSFIKDIENKKFDIVLLYQPPWWTGIVGERWTKLQLITLQLNYNLVGVIDYVYILKPKE